MEESVAERLRVQERMIEAAHAQGDDPGWNARVTVAGLQMTYTWRHRKPDNLLSLGNFYTVENLTPWTSIAHALRNPLLTAMDDLLKQKTEWKP